MLRFFYSMGLAHGSQYRLVLAFLVLGSSLLGCFSPAPRLSQPEQTPPFIISSLVTPPVAAIHELPESGTFDFVVPFRSEDANEEVVAALYLDLEPGDADPSIIQFYSLAPDTLETQRELRGQVSLREQLAAGCHSLTLHVTHDGNFKFEQSWLPLVPSLVGSVIWWLDVPDPERPTALGDCNPTRSADP
jgi:hypothetical protein